MKLILIILVFGIPGFYASLDHLSYRVRREDPDAEIEGSGAGEEINSNSTHSDEESEGPNSNEVIGGDVSIPTTAAAVSTTSQPPLQPESTDTESPAPNPPDEKSVQLDSEINPVSTTELTPPIVLENQPEVINSTTDEPVQPIISEASPTSIVTPNLLEEPEERELESEREKLLLSTDPDFSFAEPSLEEDDKVSPELISDGSTPPFVFPNDENESKNGTSDPEIQSRPVDSNIIDSPPRKQKERPTNGEDGSSNTAYNKDSQVNDLSGSTDERWSFIPVDDLSLLIFILLCLILIVILLVCCFIIQHMTSWAIIKMHPRPSSNTYKNACPIKEDEDIAVVKYTAEKEGTVQLLSVSTLQSQSQSYREEMNLKINEEKKFSMEQNEQKVHCSTAEVLIGESEGDKHYPIIIATVRKDGVLNGTLKEVIIPRPMSTGSRDAWLKETLGHTENEDGDLESRVNFDEISYLEKRKSNLSTTDSTTNMSFLQKFAVNTTSKKTVTTHNVSTLENTRSKNVTLNIDKIEMKKSSQSLDELSVDDELDDYLENTTFPV